MSFQQDALGAFLEWHLAKSLLILAPHAAVNRVHTHRTGDQQ